MVKADLFIDGGFFDNVLKQVNGGKHPSQFDYSAFADAVCRLFDCDRNRTYYYHCEPYEYDTPTMEQRDFVHKRKLFFQSLQRTPRFILRLGRVTAHPIRCQLCNSGMQCIACGNKLILKQKGADTRLAVDAVVLALKKQSEMIILIGGDADFITSFEEARNNCQTGLAYYDYHKNGGIVKYSDKLFNIFDERKELAPIFIRKFLKNKKEPN